MPRTVKVAAVQASPIAYDLSASLDKVSRLVAEASSAGAQLVVLPEAFLSAYPRHSGFAIGARTEEQREWFARYVRSAVRVPEDAVGYEWIARDDEERDMYSAFVRLCEIAKTSNVYLSIGIVERSIIGATLFCTNLLFSPRGVLLSKHRKLQPTAAERVVWSQGEATYPVSAQRTTTAAAGEAVAGGQENGVGAASNTLRGEEARARGSAGDNMPVAHTDIGRVGGLICWENFMPLSRYVLYEKGVEIYTAPTADARPTWMPSMQHIAQEGRCFVISANQYHTSSHFPSDYPANVSRQNDKSTVSGEDEVWSRGGSCIVGPLGQVLAGPLWDEEGTLHAELDLDSLDGARLDFDPVGHYAREELLKGLLLRKD